ncbi:MAG TPA: chemotaxis protein CheA [Pirellulales bacterium]|nr:chemotaxis protein CheA [Pirellulales bacterium]
MNDMDQIVKEFLVESYENLDQLDRDLVHLEEDPHDKERLASIFRTIHTIKGTSGFFAFTNLESVAHVGENLLCKLREGELTLTPEITSALLAMVDAVRQMLASVEETGSEGQNQYGELIQTLTRLHAASASSAAEVAGLAESALEEVAELVSAELEACQEAAVAAATEPEPPPAPLAEPSEPFAELAAKATDGKAGALSDGNIRVDVGLLDKLMNLVGELVLARNQILQFKAAHNDAAFVSTSQRLNLITTELQEGVMKTRMQPIGNIWNRFPRVVRDLAMACGKEVRIEMEGKETDLDKTIIEAIKDPLTHLVRNSVDHGIEPPEVRRQRGKPAEGRLFLRAFHEGGQVNIEIADDGAGIDPEKLKQKALERGLISREHAARMGEREALNLIFLPGFSTAAKVSNISGRGVGMDVVKTNIEKIGGAVDLQSELGQGTTIKIKIPLTLAIIPALVVTSGGDRYAIPQVSLLELVRLDGEQARKGIERIHGVPVYRLRGHLLPLVYLNRQLKVAGEARETDDQAVNIVVLQADDRHFGLVVDGINDTEEIVVKPLSKQLKGVSVFAGATIMGDGQVALILDVLGIAQSAGVVSETRDRSLGAAAARTQQQRDQWQALLLVGLGREGRAAIPLSLVARLEKIPLEQVERAAEQEVVQYRGRILPLIRLKQVLPGYEDEAAGDAELLQVVVYADREHGVGLVVDRILDIVETQLEVRHNAKRPGILGSAVIQQRVTDLLDVPGVIRLVDPAAYETAAP